MFLHSIHILVPYKKSLSMPGPVFIKVLLWNGNQLHNTLYVFDHKWWL